MRKFEIKEHTADIIISAEGSSKEELFLAALEGICEVVFPLEERESRKLDLTTRLAVQSVDISALIVDFLADSLSLMHRTNAVFPKVKFDELTETSCKADLYGFPADGFAEDVKAVTYHAAKVTHKDGIFRVEILLDI